ncbi:hypothetical protein KP509_21G088700 [Ceratopteris richardii]|uniref:Conserved oligomeric Golgi complex subunit 1 n=1 Tax=Ceratopteris richardii TaxID=49495 RepID=A0A8T2SDV3_CERRI|nr:hypothetical protein KP509_21G088700 [Ceratopteris richardii]KAH7316331.1 hypothetical protein KP509_21G088700 [Ceratopteris richardii]
MRGGRFQQKTSEDATLRNAEALFESRTVVEIREVEANTRKEIEEKKEELRQLVGASYRDLIESADSIANMKKSCHNVALNIQNMESAFASLKHSLAVPHPPSTPQHMDVEKKKREKLYGIGCRVKYVVDTFEKIWGCLDEHMYLEGAQRYLRASKVQSLLTESEAKGENLSHFSLLRHEWSRVEALRVQISKKSKDRLLESGLDIKQYAVALAAVAVIDELNPTQIVLFYFETRKAWLSGHLSSAMANWSRSRKMKDAENMEEVNDVLETAMILSKAANIIQLSLCHAGQLFLEVNGDPPLFFSTILSSPPGSQLFGGIPNPDYEVKLWKHHWDELETRMTSLAGQFLSETCISWIHSCGTDLSAEGNMLMKSIQSGKDLQRIEGLIRGECDSRKALEGSLEWLESAFGKSIDSPWDYVIALLLKEPLNLWNTLFERMFVDRAKGIVISKLGEIDVGKRVDDILASANSWTSSQPESAGSLGFGSTDLMWYVGTDLGKKMDDPSESILTLQVKAQEERNLGLSSIYLGPDVSQLREKVNANLKCVLEDFVSFIHAQQSTVRAEELSPFLQEHCFIWMANIVNDLLGKTLAIAHDTDEVIGRADRTIMFTKHASGRKDKSGGMKRQLDALEPDVTSVSPLVEKALVLGRTLVSLSYHSWTLPHILHPSKVWCMKDATSSESSLPWLPSPHHGAFWPEMKEFSTEAKNQPKSLVLGLTTKEDSKSEFLKLQVVLKYASLVAHSIWASWSVDRLTAMLANDLANDEDLASLSPLKGWEDTALTQLDENGAEIEVKLPLPAMPSQYVISFLFKSCQEVYRVGGHALDKAFLHLFVSRLFEKVLLAYDRFTAGLKDAKFHVSEKGILQLLFDLRFIGDVLSGGECSYPDTAIFSEEEALLSSILSSSNLVGLRKSLFQGSGTENQRKKWRTNLQDRLSGLLDPIDWATYEPPLWENEQQSYQRCAVIFGFLVQLKRLYKDTVQRPPLTAESNTLKVSASISRFTYLPISTPSLTKKSVFDESGSKVKGMLSIDHVSKLALEDDSGASLIGAKPLLKSLFNQVGSRFGEGTLKLGSMLTDSQVSRLRDKSAAAISTFGDILPSQAAGLLSSLTSGTSRSESYY